MPEDNFFPKRLKELEAICEDGKHFGGRKEPGYDQVEINFIQDIIVLIGKYKLIKLHVVLDEIDS